MSFKYRRVILSIQSKAPVPDGQWRSGKERSAPIVVDGVEISRVTLPKAKGGGRDVPPGTLNSVRKQLLLCKVQFTDFLNCPMTKTKYSEKMKAKFASNFGRTAPTPT